MKELIILTLSVFYAAVGFTQQEVEQRISMKDVRFVVLISNGSTYFKSSTDHELHIRSKMQMKGKIRGISVPAERPKFEVEYHISSDTLYLKTPQRFVPKIIGISNYSESITTTIELPKNIYLTILKGDNLYFDDITNDLLIQSAEEITFNNLTKAEIAALKCTAVQSLRLNDETKAKEFELHGNGNQILAINATRIQLHIK